MRTLTFAPVTRSTANAIQPTHCDLGRVYTDDDEATPYLFISLTTLHTFIIHEDDAERIACAILAIARTPEEKVAG